MNTNFSSLLRRRCTPLCLLLLLVAASSANDGSSPAENTGPPTARTANELVAQAATSLIQHHSIAAKLRHRVMLFDQDLMGQGQYHQLQVDGRTYVRYELKLPVGDQVASLQHVSNGRSLWIRREVPSLDDPRQMRAALTHVDLVKVRSSLRESQQAESTVAWPLASGGMAGQGGLSEMLLRLEQWFEFETACRVELHGVPVWATTGHRKPIPAASDRAADENSSVELPVQAPHTVALMIGCDDLFPYRIEFHRRKDAAPNLRSIPSKSRTSPIVLMQFYDVGFDVPVDARIFDYHTVGLAEKDGTDDYVAHLLGDHGAN
ncbi:MAG: hypothetical protein KDA60_12410 [Planctomycetales bacterium]|nr:hypothetical protein [Planctomycetales bacterium]